MKLFYSHNTDAFESCIPDIWHAVMRTLCFHLQKLEESEYDLDATPTFNTDEPESAAHVSVLDDKIYRRF